MSMYKTLMLASVLLVAGCTPTAPVKRLGLGQAATPEQIRGWDIDVRADGTGLPPGSGSVAQGRAIYETRCLACHGANGEKGTAPRLAGGQGTLATKAPVLTVGSYWPYATTLYDYIHRAMPLDSPQSLTPNEVYAVTAYTLHLNGIVKADAVLDATALAAIRMPNRNGFRPVLK
jgi:mono/diheme cytochrome c family protein